MKTIYDDNEGMNNEVAGEVLSYITLGLLVVFMVYVLKMTMIKTRQP
jgi:hypothetical protein